MRSRPQWWPYPVRVTPATLICVPLGVAALTVAGTGVLMSAHPPTRAQWALLVGLPVLALVAFPIVAGAAQVAWWWLNSHETVLYVASTVLASAALYLVAQAIAPVPAPTVPPPAAAGGLTVFTSVPVDDLTMTVTRRSVGVGDPDRQVIVDLTMSVPAGQPVQVAVVGSGTADFDMAGRLVGAAIPAVLPGDRTPPTPVDPVQLLHRLPVSKASDLLVGEGVLASREGGTVSLAPVPWLVRGATTSVLAPASPTGGAADPAGRVPVAVSLALRLTHPAVTARAGDLGQVGCASALDALAAASPGLTPGGLLRLPDSSGAWFIPHRCTVSVQGPSVTDEPVFLARQRTGGTGVTPVAFAGVSATSDGVPRTSMALTIASTSYWTAGEGAKPGNPTLSDWLLGLSGAAAVAGVGFAWWAWRRARRAAAADSVSPAGGPLARG